MKPILFNTEMVRAILDGRKTVTRRLIKPRYRDDECGFQVVTNAHTGEFVRVEKLSDQGIGLFPDGSERHVYPPYWPGDILYVRETWCRAYDGERFFYLADKHTNREEKTLLDYDDTRWKPSIHMPKEAARIFLRVTDVRVERLQDIDGEQAFLEGATAEVPGILESFEKNDMSIFPKNFSNWPVEKKADWYRSTATASYIAQCELSERLIKSFKQIWDSTIKPADLPFCGWDANPWVWVIKFQRISK